MLKILRKRQIGLPAPLHAALVLCRTFVRQRLDVPQHVRAALLVTDHSREVDLAFFLRESVANLTIRSLCVGRKRGKDLRQNLHFIHPHFSHDATFARSLCAKILRCSALPARTSGVAVNECGQSVSVNESASPAGQSVSVNESASPAG